MRSNIEEKENLRVKTEEGKRETKRLLARK